MQTRSFIILLILIPLLLLGGAALYFLGPWGEKQGEEQTENKIEILISESVISPILSFDGEKVWYMTGEGKMFRQTISPPARGGDEEGVGGKAKPGSEPSGSTSREEYLLPEPITSPVRIIWPKSGNDFIVGFSPSPSLPLPAGEGARRAGEDYALYDSASKKFHYFPPSLQKPAFLADPNKIIYDWQRADGPASPSTSNRSSRDGSLGGQHELKVSDKNGENFHKIADLRRPDYEIVPSPTKQEVVLFGRDNLEPSYLILVNLGTGEFKDIDQKDFYKNAKFSPDGSKLAVYRSPSSPSMGEDEGKGGGLMVYDLAFHNSPSPPLTLRGGWGALSGTDQITWSPDGKSIIFASKLGFFKYDLASGQQSELYKFKEGENFEPTELILHPTKNLLFFVDERSGYLHQLEY